MNDSATLASPAASSAASVRTDSSTLVVRHLKKRYGTRTVIRGLDLDIPAGSRVVGTYVTELPLPPGAVISLVVRSGHTLYTLECHLNYLAEVKQGAAVEVHTQLLAHDGKRLHIHHDLRRPGAATSLAQSEQMLMNIDSASTRSAPFDPQVLARVQALAEAQRELPQPACVGCLIALPPARA